MTELRVINAVKDRCKFLRRKEGTDDTFEWGWMAVNKRDRTKDYFNKVGEGTMEDALLWIDGVGYKPKVVTPFAYGPDR